VAAGDDMKMSMKSVADASSAETSSSSSDDSICEQWRRSIVVSDVPKEILNNLLLTLELKKRGGGKIDSHAYDAESRNLLVTFSCNDAAGNC